MNRNDLVAPARRQFEFMQSQIKETEQQNAALVEALEDTQKLLDDIYAEDIIGGKELYEVYEKNKQALAEANND